MIDYGKEFDRQVYEYNLWFRSSLRKSLEQSRWIFLTREFFFGSLDLDSYNLGNMFRMYPCFYEKRDLTLQQKAAIALGSDAKRIEDKILRGEINIELRVLNNLQDVLRDQYDFFKAEYMLECLPQKRDNPSVSSTLLECVLPS